jgi:O-antigen biosynthesis protein
VTTTMRAVGRLRTGSIRAPSLAKIPKIADLQLSSGFSFALDRRRMKRTRNADQGPMHSIIIPNKNSALLLMRCLRKIYLTTTRVSTEVIIVDNKSDGWMIQKVYRYFESNYGLRVVDGCEEFNFSKLVNAGVVQSRGEYVTLFNNDVLAMEANWLDNLADLLEFEHASVVGSVLYYPNGTIQHAGIAEVGSGRYEHVERYTRKAEFQKTLPIEALGFSCLAVTGAVMMVKRCVWDSLAGFNTNYPENNGDVEFCLRASRIGGVYVSSRSHFVHLESISRGYGRGDL